MIGSAETNQILVCDDNDSNLYRKSRILRKAGYEVLEAASGEEALRLVREHKPRIAVLDIRLPDIDGREVCRRIKSNSDTSSVVVLQMSATFVTDADTVISLEGGADACLTEPVDPPVLVATVNALLRARKAEAALRDALDREQVARNAAESANRAKDEFLATLSHELRSPIGAVLTWVNLLRSGQLDDERTDRALEAIERNTRAQVKMIEDLLDVSRIISRKMRLEFTLVDVATVVQAALDGVRESAAAKDIALSSFVDPALGPIAADAARLQQVVWNLLSNAIKFTPKGGQVTIRADAAENRARIHVTDTGRGIDPAFLPHVFERFRQADASSTRSEGGLGLGLAIVRHLVELHSGGVEAQSEGAGKGATFTVMLPVAPPAAAVIEQSTEPAKRRPMSAPAERIAGVKVLVVDDEADTREATVLLLQQYGAQVTGASSANEAVAAFEREVPDLVISDIAMPGEDGYSLIHRLRAAGYGARALALTAYAGSEDRKRILAAGYDAYLTKPIAGAALVGAVAGLAKPRGNEEKEG